MILSAHRTETVTTMSHKLSVAVKVTRATKVIRDVKFVFSKFKLCF